MPTLTVMEIESVVKEIKISSIMKARILTDGDGRGAGRLVLRVRKQRPGHPSAVWYAQQHTEGRKLMQRLGRWPEVGLPEARALFREHFAGGLASGANIRTLAKPFKESQSGTGTLRDLCVTYCEQLKADGKPSWKQATHVLLSGSGSLCGVVPSDTPANEITTGDIVSWLGFAYRRGARSYAAHQRTIAHACFQYGLTSENDYRTLTVERSLRFHLKSNPVHGVAWDDKGHTPRQRFLTPEELAKFWIWCEDHDYQNSRIARLMIIFGCRVQEAARLKSSQIDSVAKVIRWERTKTGRPLALPIPDMAWDIIAPLLGDGLLFHFQWDEDYRDSSALAVRKFRAETGIEFQARDLRRTWRTLAASAGISRECCALVQNHAPSVGSIGWRIYDKSERLDEKANALNQWTGYLKSIIGRFSGKTVPTISSASIDDDTQHKYIQSHVPSLNSADSCHGSSEARPVDSPPITGWALL